MPKKSSRTTLAPASRRSNPKTMEQTLSAPLAVNTVVKTKGITSSRTRPHPMTGMPGTRVIGRQQLTACYGSVSNRSVLLTTPSLAVPMLNNQTGLNLGFSMNPRSLVGPLGLRAMTFSQYVIRRMTFSYRTDVASTQAGAIAMGIIRDPFAYQDTFNTDAGAFACIKSLEENIEFPVRQNADLTYEYKGTQLWYLASPSAIVASNPGFSGSSAYNAFQRQQQQFILTIVGDTVYGAAVALGYVDVSYDIEFYNETPTSVFQFWGSPLENASLQSFLTKDFLDFLSTNADVFKTILDKTWTDKKRPHPLYILFRDNMAVHRGFSLESPLVRHLFPEQKSESKEETWFKV